MVYVMQFVFYSIPIAAIVFFCVSLYRYCRAKKVNKAVPGSFTPEEMKLRKVLLIISSVIAGVLAAFVVSIAVLLFLAVAFM